VLREGARAPSAAESTGDQYDGLRLVQRRRISARRPGWEVFKLRDVVQRWVDDRSTNRGILLAYSWLIFSQRNAVVSYADCLSVTLEDCQTFYHIAANIIIFPHQMW